MWTTPFSSKPEIGETIYSLSLPPLPNVAMLKEVNSEAHEYNNKIIFVDCIEEFSWAVVERIP